MHVRAFEDEAHACCADLPIVIVVANMGGNLLSCASLWLDETSGFAN